MRANTPKNTPKFEQFDASIPKDFFFAGWTTLDLRRTVATVVGQLKVPQHVVERIYNDTTGTLGVGRIHNQLGCVDDMRDALYVSQVTFSNSRLHLVRAESPLWPSLSEPVSSALVQGQYRPSAAR